VDNFYRVNDSEQTKHYAFKYSMFTEKSAYRRGKQKPEMEGWFWTYIGSENYINVGKFRLTERIRPQNFSPSCNSSQVLLKIWSYCKTNL